jgi:hypothetical protein
MLKIGASALVGILLVGTVALLALRGRAEAAFGDPGGPGGGPGRTEPVRSLPIPDTVQMGELSEAEIEALAMALDDEYKAWSVYDQVITDLGALRPFTQIVKAEQAHIAALKTLFERYELEVPANTYPGTVPSFDTRAAACAAGVQAEIDNAALYDQLFTMVDNPDIVQVFTSLQQASLTRHLPAFERCAR